MCLQASLPSLAALFAKAGAAAVTLAMVAQVRLLTAPRSAAVCVLWACHAARTTCLQGCVLSSNQPAQSVVPHTRCSSQVPLWWCIACPLVLGMLAPFLFK